MTTPIVWSIAGVDPAGLSGVMVDRETCDHLGVRSCAIITAVTAQNANLVSMIEAISSDHIAAQCQALNYGFKADAIKIGMVGTPSTHRIIADYLKSYSGAVILDPVFASSSGNALIFSTLDEYLQSLIGLFPYVDVLTPNLSEAETILHRALNTYDEIEQGAQALLELGAKSVLLKGGHVKDDLFSQDYWTNGLESFWLSNIRAPDKQYRGTGCTLSSAIAASIALGYSIKDAIVIAKMYVNRGIRKAYEIDHQTAKLFHGGWPEEQIDLPYLTINPLKARGPFEIRSVSEAGSLAEIQGSETCLRDPAILINTPSYSTQIDQHGSQEQGAFALQLMPAFKPCETGLYPVVDSSHWVQILLTEGVQCIQLRIKNKELAYLEHEIQESVLLAKTYGAQLFVNDYWQLAIRFGAHGVHLGQEDLDNADIDKIAEAGLLLGISTHCYYEVARAHALNPSYIACGPIYPTTSKIMSFEAQGIDTLKRWRRTLDYPLVAIGGINLERLPEILSTGVEGISLISAITDAEDPPRVIQSFLRQIRLKTHQGSISDLNKPISSDELVRYAQQIKLPEIGLAGQEQLKAARVLCVGLGGLGSPLLLYLAAAGVGTLGIVDDDVLELGNLQRQILYRMPQVGIKKTEAALSQLVSLNPEIQVNVYPHQITDQNAAELIAQYDIIADGSDNFYTRYLIHDHCFELKKPYVYASATGFKGYCSIFYGEQGPCFHCLFPHSSSMDSFPDCQTGGVLGVVPGLVGVIQATEIIKWILTIGLSLENRLLMIDALSMTFKTIKLTQNPDCACCVQHQRISTPLIDIDRYGIRPEDFPAVLARDKQTLLIDVRTPEEHHLSHIGGKLIPLVELPQRLGEIHPNHPVIVYCQSGPRSLLALKTLLDAGFTTVNYLIGGVSAYGS